MGGGHSERRMEGWMKGGMNVAIERKGKGM